MPNNGPRLQVVSDEQLDRIEATALRLLEEVGISLEHPKAMELLSGLGCRVEKGRVLIPPDVVHRSLDRVVPATYFRSADGKKELTIGDGNARSHPSGGVPFILDSQTGRRRPVLLQDLANATRLLDALPNVDIIIPLFGPQDVPSLLLPIASFETVLRNTTKPVGGPVERPADVHYVVAMAMACCGGEESFRARPTISIAGGPVSPLRFTADGAGAIMAIAESGAPFDALSAPSLGATSPISMAGAIAQQHAEVLASIVLAVATRPGVSVRYGSRISPINLRTATSTWGGPEIGISGAWAAQLAHRMGLACDSYGLSTSSSKLDPQLAYEKLTNAFVPVLAGVDIFSGVGSMEDLLMGGFEAAVIDDEMIGLMRHVLKDRRVDEETLAFDLMKEVILSGDVFLGQMHTVQQMRRGAVWVPGISERETGTTADPDMGVVARARQRVANILATHEVPPLPEDVDRQLQGILADANRELAPR